MRVKRGIIRHAKHKKIIKLAKGYQGRRNSVFKLAKQAAIKAGQYAYRDRRVKKRAFRSNWILKINAKLRDYNLNYSKFINLLNKNNIVLNRKILADLAENEPSTFESIIKQVK